MKWIFKAIDEDYLLFIGITSQSQGKIPVLGLPFGMGKSTLALWISFLIHKVLLGRTTTKLETYEETEKVWDCVFNNLFMQPAIIDQYVFRGPDAPYEPSILTEDEAIPFIVWDDMQETVGKNNQYDPYLKALAFRLTKGRDWFKVLVGTMPMRDELFKWYRNLFHMELIVPRRGIFEFQRTLYTRKFVDWDKNIAQAWYESESKLFGFPPLPVNVERRYKKWIKKEQRVIDKARWKLLKREETVEESVEQLTPDEASEAGRQLVMQRWRKPRK